MGTGPRFRSATTAVVRDKTWPVKRKGLVEVLRRRRPSVYSGSTPETPARMEEHFPASQLDLRLPRMQLVPCWQDSSCLVPRCIDHLVNLNLRSAVHSKRSTKLRFGHSHTGLNGNPIFQPHRNESIWICSRHPYIVFASLLNPSGKINKINKVAEREGFEPPIPVKVYTLSRRAPSATRPSLRAH
jgi:hypothetical protein